MPDDLIVFVLILILLQKLLCAGKSHLVDVLFHLFGRHADSIVHHLNGFLFLVQHHMDRVVFVIVHFRISHGNNPFQLGDGIVPVGYQFAEKDILIRIKPFLYDRKDIRSIDRNISTFMNHNPFPP